MEKYDPRAIESKWQKRWEEQGVFRQYERDRKFYALDMFPYPSGAGLHVGHPKGYIATDVVARMKQLQGFGVLHPMGWDAFGLPAEQFALKNKTHPKLSTEENIATYKRQLESIGFTYDWEREINTTDPAYYRWTQWIFLQMWKRGLAYESHEPINWCPSCMTGLANEDLEHGNCERCGSTVEKRPLRQWVLKMTDYADRLLYDLDRPELNWPESIKEQQRNWIGRSKGAEIDFPLHFTYQPSANDNRGPNGEKAALPIFTTRPDTLFGATYLVLAPEHPWVNLALRDDHNVLENKEEVRVYVENAKKKTEIERTTEGREKTGVKLDGVTALNPATNEEIPIFVADYVLAGYGTGAIMAVPAHDERDYAFAKQYDLPIREVVEECVVTTGDREDAFRDGEKVEPRVAVANCVYDPKTESFLAISWKEFEMNGVVTGGIEEGEDIEKAARREILEETGYKNLKLIAVPEVQKHTKFFHRGKKVNRHSTWRFVLFELVDDERDEMTEEDKAQHEVVWIKRGETKNFFTVAEAHWAVELFENPEQVFHSREGILVGSGEFDGMYSDEAKEKITEAAGGRMVTTYKMRDWIFSRQRYWGEPIPLIHCEKCGVVGVPEEELPVKLPEVESYEPNDSGESPLANIAEWVNVKCPKCGGEGKRETNTMPQWAGSCWYYLRYIDPHNDKALVDEVLEKKMMPVDVYVGGAEHATRHLLYARFWHKFLYDIDVVSEEEPFLKLHNVGLILASDGRKMSKRWGNVINPDDMVREFGADAFRLYEMFMGPFGQAIAWNTDGLSGTRRFLEKVQKASGKINEEKNEEQESLLQKSIKKITEDIEEFRFNTAVSQLMILANDFSQAVSKDVFERFLILLSPFAPHIAEELWEELGHRDSIFLAEWPKYDASKIRETEVTIGIQINGKVRDTLTIAKDAVVRDIEARALTQEKIVKALEGQMPKQVIVVPGRIVNIVL